MRALKRRQPKRSNDKKSSSAKSHSWLLLTVPIIIAIAAEVFLQPGLMFHLSMLAIFGWTSITEYFKQKKELHPIMKLLVPAVIAVIAYLVGGSIEKYHENKSKPIFAIETNTIETNMGNRQVDINVKICTGRMSSFTINYPVQGMITSTCGSVNARKPRSCSNRLPAGRRYGVASAIRLSWVLPG
jgi:hypothetical protein